MKLQLLLASGTCLLLGAVRPRTCARRKPFRANSISQADQAGARRYDPAALDSSKKKLNDARIAEEKGEQTQALYLAQQAELEAEMATAKGRTAEADEAAEGARQHRGARTESARERPQSTAGTGE